MHIVKLSHDINYDRNIQSEQEHDYITHQYYIQLQRYVNDKTTKGDKCVCMIPTEKEWEKGSRDMLVFQEVSEASSINI
jgi:hypothetical protein